jgi:hypothetical protein
MLHMPPTVLMHSSASLDGFHDTLESVTKLYKKSNIYTFFIKTRLIV